MTTTVNSPSWPVLIDNRHQLKAKLAARLKPLKEEVKPSSTDAGHTPGNTQDAEGAMITAEKFIESLEELSAFITLVRNRSDRERRREYFAVSESYELLDDDATEKIARLWLILRLSKSGNAALFIQQLKSLFPDESCRVTALRQMLRQRHIAETENKFLEQVLVDTIEQSNNQKGLKSGINVVLKARLYGKRLNLSPGVIRDCYRQFIETDENEREIYLHWVLMFGAARRHMMIDFMESAVLADMSANDPGCTDIEFGDILGRLTQIKIIRSTDMIFIKKMSSDAFLLQFSITEDQWLLFILPLLENADLLYEQLAELGKGKLKQQKDNVKIIFAQKIYQSVVNFPDRIFENLEQKELLKSNLTALIGYGYKESERKVTETCDIFGKAE